MHPAELSQRPIRRVKQNGGGAGDLEAYWDLDGCLVGLVSMGVMPGCESRRMEDFAEELGEKGGGGGNVRLVKVKYLGPWMRLSWLP